MVVSDAADDPRFLDNPMVKGEPWIRFYAGAPVRSVRGHNLGTLCLIDTVPRPEGLTAEQKLILQDLASMVSGELETQLLAHEAVVLQDMMLARRLHRAAGLQENC